MVSATHAFRHIGRIAPVSNPIIPMRDVMAVVDPVTAALRS